MSLESQNADFEWYKDNLESLYEKYGERLVVIKNKQVLGDFSDFSEAYESAIADNEAGTFIIQKVGPTEEAYTTYLYSLSKQIGH